MPTFVTHLVIGERVFARMNDMRRALGSKGYGSFLLGCMLVDVNVFTGMDRRQTHFVGRLKQDGTRAFRQSSRTFLDRLDTLLLRPWSELTSPERAFVTGYLCHLAADEAWKAYTWQWMKKLGIDSLVAFPVPGDVFLTAFDTLSIGLYRDRDALATAMDGAAIPDVFTHIPHSDLEEMWRVAKPHALGGGTPESYFAMLERSGKSAGQMRQVRQQHAQYMAPAIDLIQELGGVEPPICQAIERSIQTLPQLWLC